MVIGAGVTVLVVLVVLVGASAAAVHLGASTRSSPAFEPPKTTTKTVTVGTSPEGLAYDSANTEILVANTGSGTVSAVNSSTYAVKATITVGADPDLITYDPSSKDAYVLNTGSDTVSVINSANGVVHTVGISGDVLSQAYDPANGDVYELWIGSSGYEISDVNPTTFALTTIALPAGAIYMTYDNATSSLVVSSGELNELTAISSSDKATTITLTAGLYPSYMTYNPFNDDLYVTDIGLTSSGYTKTGNVSVLSSANKIVATIAVGYVPTFSSYDPDNHDMYLANTGEISGKTYPTSTVSVITSSNKLAKTITVGKFAVVASYDPKNEEMYVSCAASNETYAIDSATNAIAAKIKTKDFGAVSIYDPALGDMLTIGLSSFEDSSSHAKTIITVIPSSNTGTSTVKIGPGPDEGLAYDPDDSGVWISNHGNTVSVIL